VGMRRQGAMTREEPVYRKLCRGTDPLRIVGFPGGGSCVMRAGRGVML